ncbi:ankyrin repeat domain-containing protein 13D isoform X1 [Myzus persicae]|uniref:ankyrin repeat domain-containing protein 13D isoform X1 n=1 Tax=Myzus persicae TaxID=13164 RepID=UPI000B935D62|nr:ankyrin repeat domain-containing protein 13D isoform X1 [Myzus persicae]
MSSSDGRPELVSGQRWEARARVDFPLHYLIWLREHKLLEEKLDAIGSDQQPAVKSQLEKLDPRGRTPLMLAITLGDIESTRLLIIRGANVNVKNDEGWTALQEAIATGDPEMVKLVMEHRDYQRHSDRATDVSKLLKLLEESPDFYVEMKWEFISWVPLVSRMCPSDTYKIFKQGSNVRIDTTLLGFDQGNWERGNLSYIFLGQTATLYKSERTFIFQLNEGKSATFLEVDHEAHRVYVEEIQMIPLDQGIEVMRPSDDTIASRLSAPIVSFDIDTKKISFERNKSGIWGWRQDKSEIISDYNCKVFSASNVEFVTKSRTEHMNETEKAKLNNTKNPIQSILGSSEETCPVNKSELEVTMAEYFDELVDIKGRYIRKPIEQTTKVTKIKANLWLSEDYPLSLKEQIMPIVDLMAITSSHFAKLKDFIEMQLPSGFPVKIEIPLYHISNAQITFGNLFGTDKAIEGVQTLDSDGKMFCVVEDSVFFPPRSYVVLGAEQRRQIGMDNDEELLQFAVRQSLLETGAEEDQVDIWEALQVQRTNTPNDLYFDPADEELQRAIHASLTESTFVPAVSQSEAPDLVDNAMADDADADLKAVLRLSIEEKKQAELQARMEEEMLEKILQLSLTEK